MLNTLIITKNWLKHFTPIFLKVLYILVLIADTINIDDLVLSDVTLHLDYEGEATIKCHITPIYKDGNIKLLNFFINKNHKASEKEDTSFNVNVDSPSLKPKKAINQLTDTVSYSIFQEEIVDAHSGQPNILFLRQLLI